MTRVTELEVASTLLLTKPEIAALAKVQRPVVTMWAKRYRGDDRPFPAPVQADGRGDRFDAGEVVDWIRSRGLGNSESLAEDLALHAALDHRSPLDADVVFAGITALLCAKSLLGVQLSELDADNLLDEVDELDPDDEFLYSEVASLAGETEVFASYVDRMADAAYTPAQAFESMMANRFRRGHRDLSDSALTARALELGARVCAALTTDERAVYVDPSADGSDLLVALRAALPEYTEPVAMTGADGTATSRLARRRLAVHQWSLRAAPEGGFAEGFSIDGPAMFLTQYPSPCSVGFSDAQILAGIDDIALQMGPGHHAVVLGPASALVDELADRDAESIRSALLRSDRVRAVVRLPEGLVVTRPGLSMAMWVLGSADPAIKPADRWTVLADLGAVELDDAAIEGVISDVCAAMGSWESLRAHAFHFGAVIKTAVLLAVGGGLTPPRRHPVRRRLVSGGEAAGRVIELIDSVNHAAAAVDPGLRLPVEYRESGGRMLPTAGELAQARELKVLPGNRIDDTDIAVDGGIRVIGCDEVLGGRALGERGIDRLDFVAKYPSGRYTEPGDIVFCTSPAFGVTVDVEGSSVVLAPARVMRIADPVTSGLIPDLIARHLSARGLGKRTAGAIRSGDGWRTWEIPRVPPDLAAGVAAALAELRQRRSAAARLLTDIDRLTDALVDGVAHGALTVAEGTETDKGKG